MASFSKHMWNKYGKQDLLSLESWGSGWGWGKECIFSIFLDNENKEGISPELLQEI